MKRILFITFVMLSTQTFGQSFQWAKTVSSDTIGSNAGNNGLVVDADGNSYITGHFRGTVDFDPSTGTLLKTSIGEIDFFISKIDSNGLLVWNHTFGSIGVDDANNICLDNLGNIYVTGCFRDSVDFDPSSNSYFVAANQTNYAGFVLKLSSSGQFIWVSTFQPNSSIVSSAANGLHIKLDNYNNVVVSGELRGQVDFDPSINILNIGVNSTSSGLYGFICKLNNSGQIMWANYIPTIGTNLLGGMDLDSNNSIYLGGNFQGSGDFDPGSGSVILTASNYVDAFLLKLDSSGNYNWVFQIGGISGQDGIHGVAVSNLQTIDIIGKFGPSADFDPSSNSHILNTNSGWVNSFLASYSVSGNLLWAEVLDDSLLAVDITHDVNNNIFICGHFQGQCDFDPQNTKYNLLSNGDNDAFMAKYNSVGIFKFAKNWGGTGNDFAEKIALNNLDVYTFGGYTSNLGDFDPTNNFYPLDSIAPVNNFLNKISDCTIPHTTITYSDCDSLIHNNTTYLNSTSYVLPFISASGCDSNVVIDINIENSNIYNNTLQSCGPINFGGQIIDSSGIYNHTFLSAQGCDSSVNLHFVMNKPAAFVTQQELLLSDTNSNATYQWLKCNPYAIIPGATNQTYTTPSGGDYAVIVTQNGCSDTSACVMVQSVGMDDISLNGISVYPNPSTGTFVISAINSLERASLKVMNLLGQVVYQKNNLRGAAFEIDLANQPNGVYTLAISDGDNVSRMKLIKQ